MKNKVKLLTILMAAAIANPVSAIGSDVPTATNLTLKAVKDILVPAGTDQTEILHNSGNGSFYTEFKCVLKHDKRGFDRKIKNGSRFLMTAFSQTKRKMDLHEKSRMHIEGLGGIYNEEIAAGIKSEADLDAILSSLLALRKYKQDPIVEFSQIELFSSETGNKLNLVCHNVLNITSENFTLYGKPIYELSFDSIMLNLLSKGLLAPETDL